MNNIMAFEDKNPEIGAGTWIHPATTIIGDVQLGKDVSVWPGVIMRGDVHQIVVGDRTNIQDGSIIHVTSHGRLNDEGFPTIIGSDVTIGHGVMLHGCIVEDATLIGMRAILLDGARVEKHAMLAAGSLLAPEKVVKSGELWMGSPARKVRTLSDAEIEGLYRSAAQYVALKDRYLKDDARKDAEMK